MNHKEGVKRGDLIKPSARKSIHSHRFCPFSRSELEMVRYGLKALVRNDESSGPSHDEGRDEVDNVMSKFSYPIDDSYKSSKSINRRRSSIDNPLNSHFNRDDNLSSVLSQSLPTTLPSRSYYSDDSNDEGQTSYQSDSNVYHYVSKSDGSQNEESFQHSSPERESSVYTDGIRRRYQNHQSPEKKRAIATKSRTPIWPILLVVSFAASVIAFQNFATSTNVVHNFIYDKNNFYNDMMNLAKKYNVKHESIEQVQIGVSTIMENEDADSFVFVYNSELDSFNPEEFNNFMDDIAYFAAKYLRNNSASVRHTVVDGSRLSMRNSEELIERYSDDVKRTGVMLVKGIDSVPSTLAMAFHYYCDEYNPVAKKSAIFSTFDLANCSNGKTSTHATLEKCLKNKWKGVPSANMGPLLTRVVSVVVDLTNGF